MVVTFDIDKWVAICAIKLEDRSFHFAMATAQIKGVKNGILVKHFLNSDLRNGISNYQLITLPTFAVSFVHKLLRYSLSELSAFRRIST